MYDTMFRSIARRCHEELSEWYEYGDSGALVDTHHRKSMENLHIG